MTNQPISLSSRCVYKATGNDVVPFLNKVLTCRLDNMADPDCRFGALLTPQGKILTDLFVFRKADVFWLDLPVSTAQDTIKRLTMLKLRADVTFEAAPEKKVVTAKSAFPVQTSEDLFVPDPRSPEHLFRGIRSDETITADESAWTSLRTQFALPECSLDYEPATAFPADVNMDLLNGVDFKKGCFVGQEVVSRMKRKTIVRKRTIIATGPTGVSPKDELVSGESKLGEVLCWSGDAGLVLTRLDRLSADNGELRPVEINGQTANIQIPDVVRDSI